MPLNITTAVASILVAVTSFSGPDTTIHSYEVTAGILLTASNVAVTFPAFAAVYVGALVPSVP